MNKKFSLVNAIKILVIVYLSQILLSSYISSLKSKQQNIYLSKLPETVQIDQPLGFGEYQITINSLEKSKFIAENLAYKSIIINFTITNTSEEPIYTEKPNFEIVDSEGKYYINPSYGIKMPDAKLGAHHSTTGILLFSVPDDKQIKIVLADNRNPNGIEVIQNQRL